jgi:hypothetical protein
MIGIKNVFHHFFNEALTSKSAFIIIDKTIDSYIVSTRFYDYKPENRSVAIGYTFLERKY